jgi:hypothetical protein
MLIAGQWYLRPVLEECVAHCNRHRSHRARNLNLRPPHGGVIAAAIPRNHEPSWAAGTRFPCASCITLMPGGSFTGSTSTRTLRA